MSPGRNPSYCGTMPANRESVCARPSRIIPNNWLRVTASAQAMLYVSPLASLSHVAPRILA